MQPKLTTLTSVQRAPAGNLNAAASVWLVCQRSRCSPAVLSAGTRLMTLGASPPRCSLRCNTIELYFDVCYQRPFRVFELRLLLGNMRKPFKNVVKRFVKTHHLMRTADGQLAVLIRHRYKGGTHTLGLFSTKYTTGHVSAAQLATSSVHV